MQLKTMRDAHVQCRKANVAVGGFTLLEVLLAVFLFAVSILTMISTLTFTMRAVNQNQQALFAKTAVNAELERRRNMDFNSPDLNVGGPYSFPVPVNQFVDGLPGVKGNVVIDAPSPGLKRITVTVPVDNARQWRLSTLATEWTTNLGNQLYSAYPPTE